MATKPVRIDTRTEIEAPASRVWETLRSFERIEEFLPSIEHSSVEGTGEGATRVCQLRGGGQLEERLEALDDENMELTYSIVSSPMPIRNYLSTMRVRDGSDGRSTVTWTSTFDAPSDSADEVGEGMRKTYEEGLQGLRDLHRAR